MTLTKIPAGYIICALIMLSLLSCKSGREHNSASDNAITVTNAIWYKQCSADLGYRIDMINDEFGLAISRGKGNVDGHVYVYQNNTWNSFASFNYSDYPAIKWYGDSSFFYLIHESHFGNYKPRLYFVNDFVQKEVGLPDVMWDDRDYSMWKSLSVTPGGDLWLAGQKGNLLSGDKKNLLSRNDNSGKNRLYNFLGKDINDICMMSDSTGWAACGDGSIYRYRKNEWTKVSSLSDQPLNKLSMFDDSTGWAVGDKGTVLRCIDYNWMMYEVPSRESLYSIKVLDNDNVWIVGTHSTLLTYKDKGFVRDKSITSFNDTFLDIDVVKDANGKLKLWIIGNEGIYTTTYKHNFSFTDITAQSSLTRDGLCGIFFNHNDDNYADLLIMSEEGPNLLFNNSTGDVFSELSRESGLTKYLGVANTILTGDFNNDGNADILEVLDNSEYKLSLGMGSNNFIDWTEESEINLAGMNVRSQFFSTTAADFNNDGNLDVYITNFNNDDFLLVNNGAGQFTNEWNSSGIDKQLNQQCMGSILSDFNNDNMIDILLVYRLGENHRNADLYLNDGNLHFRRKNVPAFVSGFSEVTFSAIADDFNNDGNTDIVIFNNESPLTLLLNNGSAEFNDVSDSCGFTTPVSHLEPSHGVLSAADINNDGWLDIFAGSKLFLNSPRLFFTDVTNYSGINFGGNATFSDIDFDGDYDLYIGSSRTALGGGDRSALFRNNLSSKRFIKVKLYPDISNRSAIGTRVDLTGLNQSGDTVSILTQLCGLGANPLIQKDYSSLQFSLSDSLEYSMHITFPSGNTSSITDIATGEVLPVYESGFILHFIIIQLNAIERTIKLLDWTSDSLKFTAFLISIFIALIIGRRFKSYRIIKRWYYNFFVLILFAVLLHLSIIHGALFSFLATILPMNVFLYTFVFVSHKIIETKESKLISHYKLLELLGSGGMGDVYKALDIKNSKTVAVKILKPEFTADETSRDIILHEGRTLLKFNHPNIVKVFEVGSGEDQTFIAMEYLPGSTLNEFIKNNYPLDMKSIVGITENICSGLSEVHNSGLVHRDLKSQNIMFDENMIVKIMDFGLSKSPVYQTQTGNSGIAGTLGYMAPEQVTSSNIDHRADIYSLGIIMYYMATNRMPFTGENEIALIHSIFNSEPVAPSKINSTVTGSAEKIILKCLEKSPAARYGNVSELVLDLKKVKQHE